MTRVAIVTASDSGIGKTTALMLAERGFDIGVTWHSDEKGALETCREVEAQGQRAEAVHLDLSTLPEGAEAIETLIARFGRLDVLVNNAGAMTKAPFLEMPFDDWRNIFTVDVDGAFLCSQIAARQMVKQGEGGRIVNITSVHEHTPLPQASAYTAAKHALGGLNQIHGDGAGEAQHSGERRRAGCDCHADERHGRQRSEGRLHAGNPAGKAGPHERDCQPGGVAV